MDQRVLVVVNLRGTWLQTSTVRSLPVQAPLVSTPPLSGPSPQEQRILPQSTSAQRASLVSHPFQRALNVNSWSPKSRYRRSLQYKWGTEMCPRKKCLDINQRLIIIFIPCSKKIKAFSFQNASSSVLLAVLCIYFLLEMEGWAAERSRSETNGSVPWTY